MYETDDDMFKAKAEIVNFTQRPRMTVIIYSVVLWEKIL